MWGGTLEYKYIVQTYEFQSTRPVWGGTKLSGVGGVVAKISIHPPRVGRDRRTIQGGLQ